MYTFLRRFRIVISLLILLAITICFVDVYNLTNYQLGGLLRWQFVPALLGIGAGSLGVFIFLLLLTVIFGRVYCSTLCPLGTYQDIVRRVANLFKSKKARRMHYHPPLRILRYALCVITFAFFIFGSSALLLWLDPYSNFGRMAANLLGLGVTAGGNLLSDFIYSIPAHNYKAFTWGAIISATIIFLVVTIMSALRGRLFCNTICPVGSLLGAVSRYSLFRLHIDAGKCTRCTLCSAVCKAQCINIPEQKVDNNRCVKCYDCVPVCKFNAIGYKYVIARRPQADEATQISTSHGLKKNRRLFLTALFGVAAAGIITKRYKPAETAKAIAPPGCRGTAHLKHHCTACHACIANCPSRVLRPASTEYGLDGFAMPVLDYNRSFCNYNCTVCTEVCPNGAILPLTKEEKAVTQIGKAQFFRGRCIVARDETDCGACHEHCPATAITMVPYGDGLLIPRVDTSICIGCGGCEYICPARPHKAIIVKANHVHQTAGSYREKEKEEKKVDNFGF